MQRKHLDASKANVDGWTPLHLAAMKGLEDVFLVSSKILSSWRLIGCLGSN